MLPVFPRRRNLRLPGYDYSSEGLYFVTICTDRRRLLFGNIADGTMQLNRLGVVVDGIWSSMFRFCEDVPTWTVMPNHLHGIVTISDGATTQKSLGRLIAAFKTISTKRINELRNTPGQLVWQRNFYEHIIASDRALSRIVGYIQDNPMKWNEDPENPAMAMRQGNS